MSSVSTLLRVEDLTVVFGGLTAVDEATFEVAAGTVTGLIGPNGAGKTTCFNAINGLVSCRGRILLEGQDITRSRPYIRARHGMSRTFQRLETFKTLTVRENVLVAAEMSRRRLQRLGLTPPRLTDSLLKRVGIDDVADIRVEMLPTGHQRLVELARALASAPRLLLLDEPSSGLNDQETIAFSTLLGALAGEGLGILVVEHDMPFIMGTCSHINVLNFGRIISSGTPAEVRADQHVRSAYLGENPGESSPPKVAARPQAAAVASSAGQDRGIELRNVTAGYDLIDVIVDLSIDVPRGSVVALLGANGAGKSTMLKVASGELPMRSGDLNLLGERVNGRRADELARRGLCCVPEGRGIFPNLTVTENLVMASHSGKDARTIQDRAFERFPVLADRRHQPGSNLSGGEQQMLAMARALTTDPSVLLVDELSMGLAPLIVQQLYETVATIAEAGVAVLIVEQFAHDILAIADTAHVMAGGRIVMTGTPEEVAAGMDEVYLGLAPAG